MLTLVYVLYPASPLYIWTTENLTNTLFCQCLTVMPNQIDMLEAGHVGMVGNWD